VLDFVHLEAHEVIETTVKAQIQERYIAFYKEHENNDVVCELLGIKAEEGLKILTNKFVFSTLARAGCYMDSESIFMQLEDKEQAFVNEYMVDFNAGKAAARAGFADSCAAAYGRKMLLNSMIRFCIMCRQLELRDISQVTSQAVLTELTKIAFADIGEYVEFNNNMVTLRDSGKVDTSVISEVQSTQYGVKIKLHNKANALEMIGKHLGMFKDKVEVTGKDGGPIQVEATLNVLRSKFDAIVARAANQLKDDLNKEGETIIDPAAVPAEPATIEKTNKDGENNGWQEE